MKVISIILTLVLVPLIFNVVKWVNYNNYELKHSDFIIKYENNKVRIMENNDFKVFIFNQNSDFRVVNGKPSDCTFYLNTNFFDKENNPIGLVVIEGKRYSDRINRGGFLYVLDGKTYVSKNCPLYTDHSTQAYLWGISNGQVNNRLINMKHAKEKTYRNLVGQDNEGNTIIVTSRFGSMVTIEEIIEIGKEYNMVNAVLFDGGTSLDYKYSDGDYSTRFKSLPNWLGFLSGYGNPTTYLCVN